MYRLVSGGVALSVALVWASFGLLSADDRDTAKTMSDKDFVAKAASGGMFEVKSSELAVDRARSEVVKTFARRMIKDHGAANKGLTDLAKKAGFDVPTSMNDKHQKLYDSLREATAFDRQYIKDQVAAHAEAIALFNAEVKHGKNADLRAWAKKTLPTLREHQMMIRKLAGR
jgi:putative membrane protein